MQSAHRVGTLVQLTEVDAYEDGRYDIEVIGRQRLRVVESDNSGPFLRGEVELLPDPDEPEAAAEAELALATFETYRTRLSGAARRPGAGGRAAGRPGLPLLRPGQHLPAHPAAAAGAARGGERAAASRDAASHPA
jgi:hypothetical protein